MRALAAKAKLKSVAFIADLEKGFRYPSLEVMTNLAQALGVPLAELRDHDRRPPLEEISALTAKDPAWAAALRKVVDQAHSGKLTPKSLTALLDSAAPETHKQPTLPF